MYLLLRTTIFRLNWMAKGHSKAFEDSSDKVWIWSEVEEMLMQYNTSFYNGEGIL